MQVAQALRDRCQRFLAEQLPQHQVDVSRAAGTLAAFNESDGRPTDEMLVDQNSPEAAAGEPLADAIVTDLWRFCLVKVGWVHLKSVSICTCSRLDCWLQVEALLLLHVIHVWRLGMLNSQCASNHFSAELLIVYPGCHIRTA